MHTIFYNTISCAIGVYHTEKFRTRIKRHNLNIYNMPNPEILKKLVQLKRNKIDLENKRKQLNEDQKKIIEKIQKITEEIERVTKEIKRLS